MKGDLLVPPPPHTHTTCSAIYHYTIIHNIQSFTSIAIEWNWDRTPPLPLKKNCVHGNLYRCYPLGLYNSIMSID